MERDEKKKREEELDRFWDIDALIPQKRAPHYPSDTSATEIVLEAKPAEKTTGRSDAVTERIPPEEEPKRHFIPPHTADELRQRQADLEYVPENALIRRVRIFRRKSNYRYYEDFVRDAERLYAVRGAECGRVPFFSYVPHYTQMTRPQLEWYLWWRTNFRQGNCLDTDYSYLLLYAYELINLSHKVEPIRTRDALCRLWVHYRGTFYQLDSQLPNWICDLCLLLQLPPPEECTGALLSAVMAHCTLKEFYVPSGGEDGYIRALLAFCSNYDYRKSKFCTEEHQPLFDRTVFAALRTVTQHMSRDGQLFSASGMDDSKMMREAFVGALCSHRHKCKIEVEYCSFSGAHELRYFVTDVVKYTENKLRASLGIRSRLTVYALPTSTRELLDQALEALLPKKEAVSKKAQEESAAYEKLYDLPQKALSLSHAAEIERQSWDTTERLVEAFEDAAEETVTITETEAPLPDVGRADDVAVPAPSSETDGDLQAAFAPYRPLLIAVRERNSTAVRQVAMAQGVPLEVLVDEVNSLAADLMGDILLEECDGDYVVIEDYLELLNELLSE